MALSPSATPIQMRIEAEDDIVLVRQKSRALALEIGFDPFAVAAITTAASELSRNIWVHGGGKGTATIQVLREGGNVGLELVFEDQGPGIADVHRALNGGYSTKTLGLGLIGTKRLVDEFHIDTEVGRGTKVTIRKWKRKF